MQKDTVKVQTPAPHRSKPVVVTHAEFLVSAYGKTRALQIAEVNSKVDGKDSYWMLVFQAIDEAGDPADARE